MYQNGFFMWKLSFLFLDSYDFFYAVPLANISNGPFPHFTPWAGFVFVQPNFKNGRCTANAIGHAIQPHINHHNSGNQIFNFLVDVFKSSTAFSVNVSLHYIYWYNILSKCKVVICKKFLFQNLTTCPHYCVNSLIRVNIIKWVIMSGIFAFISKNYT